MQSPWGGVYKFVDTLPADSNTFFSLLEYFLIGIWHTDSDTDLRDEWNITMLSIRRGLFISQGQQDRHKTQTSGILPIKNMSFIIPLILRWGSSHSINWNKIFCPGLWTFELRVPEETLVDLHVHRFDVGESYITYTTHDAITSPIWSTTSWNRTPFFWSIIYTARLY